MKISMKFASAAATLLLLGGGCLSKPVATTPNEPLPAPRPGDLDPYLMPAVEFGADFELAKDESRVFEDGLTVGLLEINDSRCAKDVVCIWAGELGYLLGLSHNGDNPPKDWTNQVRLGTTTAKEAQANGYNFILVEGREDGLTLRVTR